MVRFGAQKLLCRQHSSTKNAKPSQIHCLLQNGIHDTIFSIEWRIIATLTRAILWRKWQGGSKRNVTHIVVDEHFYPATVVMNHSTSMNLLWFSSGTLQLWNIPTYRKKRIFSGVIDWKTVCSGSRVKQYPAFLDWNRKNRVIMNLT